MTAEACACGCVVPVTTGSFWAEEDCLPRWLRRVHDPVLLPGPAWETALGDPTVRVYCGSTYTEKPSVDLPVEMDPDSDTPPLPPAVEGGPEIVCPAVDVGPEVAGVADVSWLARWLDRMFGRPA